MACLLYSIAFSEPAQVPPRPPPLVLPPGVGGAPLQWLEADGLRAAVSTVDRSQALPNLERALAFARVVQMLHADRAVVPVRFGCLFEQEAEVIHLLRTRAGEYTRLLRALEGCVEMGVRALRPPPRVAAASAGPDAEPPCESDGGGAYLARRGAVYAKADRLHRELVSAGERVRRALAGRFVQFRVEAPGGMSRFIRERTLLSTYFLIRREALEAFREAVRELSRVEAAPFLLSGPWPPYNFVLPES